jgi:flagellar hook-associated protein 1 FlgK
MSIDAAISIANTGLDAIDRGFSLISQNVANASTPGYATETETLSALDAGGVGQGVQVGPDGLSIDAALSQQVLTQTGASAAASTTSTALAAIDQAEGTPGAGTDLGSLLGTLQTAFTTLADNPADATQQQAVVSAAGTLASGINQLSGVIGAQRQDAQNAIASSIAPINAAITTIGTLSNQIVSLQAQGQSTADLANQRNAALATLSSYMSVQMQVQPDGDAVLIAGGGLQLPIHGGGALFATSNASVGPTSTYPGAIPAVTLDGQDVTDDITGGSLGANITLRDQTLPAAQAGLDEVAAQLSNRFDAQGLTLFTRPDGSLPVSTGPDTQSGYVGYAAEITVNPAVTANAALVVDGTRNVTGSATGASAFTTNPSTGPAGFTTLIDRVLNYALGDDAQAGVAQPAVPTTGLGPAGTLAAPGLAQGSLSTLLGSYVAAQSAAASQSSTEADTSSAALSSLQTQLSNADGVNVDSQMALMVQLQNAYGANARIIATAQAMWSTLLAALPTP